jgi:CRP-like cAMP-binding protein
MLFEAGDYPTGVHLICGGRVKLWCSREDSRRFVWRFADTGELLDTVTLFAQTAYPTVAETSEPCLIRFFPKDMFFQLLGANQMIESHLLRRMCLTLSNTLEQLEEFVFSQSALERLELLLFRLSTDQQMTASEGVIRVWITRREMADRIGVAPETVSRLLGKLVKKGVIKRDRRSMIILHPQKLKLTGEE